MPKNATLFFDIELLKIDGKDVNECNEVNGQWPSSNLREEIKGFL